MSTVTSQAVEIQAKADDIVASWLTVVERFNPATIKDEDLEDRSAQVIETIRTCRAFALDMSAEYRPVKKLGDVIGHDSLKRSLMRLFKIGQDTSLGAIKKGYRNYLKDNGKM